MRNDTRRQDCKDYIKKLKSESCCIRCGAVNDLTFHHRNPSDKLFDIASAPTNRVHIERLEKEIAKCDILCRECHRLEHEDNLVEIPAPLKQSDFSVSTYLTETDIEVIIEHVDWPDFRGRGRHIRRMVAHDLAIQDLMVCIINFWRGIV